MSFLSDRIAATEQQIINYENAISALSSGIEEYSLDTGQSVQRVKRSDTGTLQKTVDNLYIRLYSLQARQGGNATYVRPSW